MKLTKKKTVVLCMLGIFLLAAIGLCKLTAENKKAYAATNSTAVYTTEGIIETPSGTFLRNAPKDNFTITMESLYSSGTGTLNNNALIDWTYAVIKVNVKNIIRHYSFSLERDGIVIASKELSGKNSMTLFTGSLSDGSYILTYVSKHSVKNTVYDRSHYRYKFTVDNTAPKYELKAGGISITNGANTAKNITYSASDTHFERIYYKSPTASGYSFTTSTSYTVEARASNSGWWYFYAEDSLDQKNATVRVYMDCIPPEITCSGGVRFGTTVGESVQIMPRDEVSTSKLYVRFESEAWFSAGTSYTLSDTERNGRYYFYAEDGNGNRSDTYWLILSTEAPVGRLIKSQTDNSYTFVWDNEYWTATLDGKPYTNGRIITAEGMHEIVISNNANKIKTYTFQIDHYFEAKETVAPTCTEQGYTVYRCKQCNTEEKRDYIAAAGHKYVTAIAPPTCTESKTVTYTCEICGFEYKESGELPSGHLYNSRILKSPSCTTAGKREFTCEKCGDTYTSEIPATGHDYTIINVEVEDGKTLRTYACKICGANYVQDLGDQSEYVTSYVEYLFNLYSPYMIWVFLATAGIWSIVLGVMIILAHRNEEKEKAKKMLVNYLIGLVVIFAIVVACPFLVNGIAALVT